MRVEIKVDGIRVPYDIPDELIETIYRERQRICFIESNNTSMIKTNGGQPSIVLMTQKSTLVILR